MIRAHWAKEAEHQAIVRDAGCCQEFITQRRNFQVIYEQANAHGQKQAAGNNIINRQRRSGWPQTRTQEEA